MRPILTFLAFALLLAGCAAPAPASTATPACFYCARQAGTMTALPAASETAAALTTERTPQITPSASCDRQAGTMTARPAASRTAAALTTELASLAEATRLVAGTTPTPTLTATPACCKAEVCYLDGHFLLQRPIPADGNQSIDQTYRYGSTQGETREAHHGVEFPNTQGTPVLAAADGTVVFAGDDKLTLLAWTTGFYGNVVVLRHDLPGWGATYTLYGHLFKVDAQTGQNVAAGDKIGEVGATGTAIGSHLHFEVRLARNDYKSNRNPELWLQPLPGTGALAGRIVNTGGVTPKGQVNIQRVENGVILKTPVILAETYTRENMISVQGDDAWHENFAAGELPAGDYRLTLVYNGVVYEKWVKIEAGKLTLVTFIVE